jgi:hypothetical protein
MLRFGPIQRRTVDSCLHRGDSLRCRWLAYGLLAVGLLAVAGCGRPKEAEDPHVVESAGLPDADTKAPVLESVDTPLTELERAKVVKAVDEGLGHFLQGVELEASLKDGRFEGFRIVRFAVPEDWRGVGILVGDVITSINDLPIERPEQAHAAFVALRTAPALEVGYLRAGSPMRLSLPIVGSAPSAAARAPAPAPAAESKPTAGPAPKKSAP